MNINPEELKRRAKIQRSWIHRGQESACRSSLVNYPIIFNSVMQSRRMRTSCASLPTLLSPFPPPSSLEERFGVTRPSFRFRLSVSARFAYRVHCVHRILGRRRKSRKHRGWSRRWSSYIESMRNFFALERDLLPRLSQTQWTVCFFSKINRDDNGGCQVSLMIGQVSYFRIIINKYICRKLPQINYIFI